MIKKLAIAGLGLFYSCAQVLRVLDAQLLNEAVSGLLVAPDDPLLGSFGGLPVGPGVAVDGLLHLLALMGGLFHTQQAAAVFLLDEGEFVAQVPGVGVADGNYQGHGLHQRPSRKPVGAPQNGGPESPRAARFS